jgi:hypothetical protein
VRNCVDKVNSFEYLFREKVRVKKNQKPVAPVYTFNGEPVSQYATECIEGVVRTIQVERAYDDKAKTQSQVVLSYLSDHDITLDQLYRNTEDVGSSYVWKLAGELGVSFDEANQFLIENVI